VRYALEELNPDLFPELASLLGLRNCPLPSWREPLCPLRLQRPGDWLLPLGAGPCVGDLIGWRYPGKGPGLRDGGGYRAAVIMLIFLGALIVVLVYATVVMHLEGTAVWADPADPHLVFKLPPFMGSHGCQVRVPVWSRPSTMFDGSALGPVIEVGEVWGRNALGLG
jgi:hypothetical protein